MDRAWKYGDHVRELHVADNLALTRPFLDAEVLIRDFQTRAVAGELVVNPSLRCANTVRGIVLRRKHVTRAKAFEPLERGGHTLFRDGIHDPPQGGIDTRVRGLGGRRARERGRRAENRKTAR